MENNLLCSIISPSTPYIFTTECNVIENIPSERWLYPFSKKEVTEIEGTSKKQCDYYRRDMANKYPYLNKDHF